MRVTRSFAASTAFVPCAVLAGVVQLIQLVPEDLYHLAPRCLHPIPANKHMNSFSTSSQILHEEIALEPRVFSEIPLLAPSQMDTQHAELPPASMATDDCPNAAAPTALTSETLNNSPLQNHYKGHHRNRNHHTNNSTPGSNRTSRYLHRRLYKISPPRYFKLSSPTSETCFGDYYCPWFLAYTNSNTNTNCGSAVESYS